jgi:hypothetical protein
MGEIVRAVPQIRAPGPCGVRPCEAGYGVVDCLAARVRFPQVERHLNRILNANAMQAYGMIWGGTQVM